MERIVKSTVDAKEQFSDKGEARLCREVLSTLQRKQQM